jgi:hypothetical protein
VPIVEHSFVCGAETGTLRKVDQKCLGSFEMWCWRRVEKIGWTDRVRSEEVLHGDKEKSNVLHTAKRRKANWIVQILCRNWVESYETWCWRRVEKIGWTERVRSEEVLHRVKDAGNVLHTAKRRKANCIGHILRGNCLLKHVITGRIKRN